MIHSGNFVDNQRKASLFGFVLVCVAFATIVLNYWNASLLLDNHHFTKSSSPSDFVCILSGWTCQNEFRSTLFQVLRGGRGARKKECFLGYDHSFYGIQFVTIVAQSRMSTFFTKYMRVRYSIITLKNCCTFQGAVQILFGNFFLPRGTSPCPPRPL